MIEDKIEDGIENCSEQDLWIGSILQYQKGKFDISLQMLQTLLQKNNNFTMAWYNLGHVASKLMRRKEAVCGFTEFSKRNPQSWWAIVARGHLRRLQASWNLSFKSSSLMCLSNKETGLNSLLVICKRNFVNLMLTTP